MVSSPNRKYISYVGVLLDERLQISEDDFQKIERAGNCKLTNILKEEISQILDSFLTNTAIEMEAYTRLELYQNLKKIFESAFVLNEIFGDQNNHLTCSPSLVHLRVESY